MTQSPALEPASSVPIRPLRFLVDLLQSARYSARNTAVDLADVARMHAMARYELARGRPEAALLQYGHAIRHVKLARQSMATYEAVERLIERYPSQLASYRLSPVQPQRALFFVGYSRSGHSLVGALLDAHPNVVVSHELHALKHLRQGRTFASVVSAIQRNSQFFHRFGRGYSGYSYEVPSQWQGRYSELRVIGDKKANGTCGLLRRHPGLVDQFDRTLPVPYLFIHVVRNPYDNIASRARRIGTSLNLATYGYFANVEVIDRLKRRHPDRVVDVYLDDLIAEPRRVLVSLLHRIGIDDISDQYVEDCAKLVFEDTRRTRDAVEWDPALRKSIAGRLAQYSFLSRFASEL